MPTEVETPEVETPEVETPADLFDWSSITGEAVEKLRQPKTPPPPPAHIIKLAQMSYDGETVNGVKKHVRKHDFEGDTARRDKFVELIKLAGAHTTPPTSVRVVLDPENSGNEHMVSWQAGERRGHKV